jgi:ubiquinone/menaquinone biosynthesis C-methylase UbiE
VNSPEDIRTMVRERYAQAAQGGSLCCGPSCCGPDVNQIAQRIGYRAEDLALLPEGANLGLGCGNPLKPAALQPGETVLDLGSGAGVDCLLAAHTVGPKGRVIGVDMTPAMIEKARANAQSAGLTNVEFRLGEIEYLPAADNSVDVVISNCVINLSPDKAQVFHEALRVLKPGGRMLVSDLVLRRPLSERLKNSVEAYVGCVAGALLKEDYLQAAREAGFAGVEVFEEHAYDVQIESVSADLRAEALASVVSIKVRAAKPAR